MKYLFVLHILILFKEGKCWMPKLAAVDLLAHKRLLPSTVRLTLAAPVVEKLNGDLFPLDGIGVTALKHENSFKEGIVTFLPNCLILFREIKQVDFVHTGCGGFPFFLSIPFLAHLISLFFTVPRLFVMDCDLIGKIEEEQIALAPTLFKKLIWIAYAKFTWQLFKFCLKTTESSFLLGRGVVKRYGKYARNPLEIYQPVIGLEKIIPEKQLAEKLRAVRSGSPLKAIFVGRLAYEKGIDILLIALKMLQDKGIELETDIIGDGPERTALEDLLNKLEVKSTFHGVLEWGDPLFLKIREAHLFIVSHRTEEMTRAAIEGPASGCVLVCSDTAALQQLVMDSSGGMTFKKGDSTSLSQVIEHLLKERETTARFIENGIDFFKKNHRDAHIKRRIYFLKGTFQHLDWGQKK